MSMMSPRRIFTELALDLVCLFLERCYTIVPKEIDFGLRVVNELHIGFANLADQPALNNDGTATQPFT